MLDSAGAQARVRAAQMHFNNITTLAALPVSIKCCGNSQSFSASATLKGLYDDEIERERMRNVRRRIDTFMEESAMTIHQNGYSQWREALLYNIGAVSLPEGGDADAGDEFDAAWQNAMRMR